MITAPLISNLLKSTRAVLVSTKQKKTAGGSTFYGALHSAVSTLCGLVDFEYNSVDIKLVVQTIFALPSAAKKKTTDRTPLKGAALSSDAICHYLLMCFYSPLATMSLISIDDEVGVLSSVIREIAMPRISFILFLYFLTIALVSFL